jgi:hypothetical protein
MCISCLFDIQAALFVKDYERFSLQGASGPAAERWSDL